VSKAIPTMYNGVQYRSMLEARWAAFFELMCIPTQYEPEALNGYIPDFVIRANLVGFTILVEVKGLLENFDLQKIRRAGWGKTGWVSGQDVAPFAGMVLLLTGQGPGEAVLFLIYQGHEEARPMFWGHCRTPKHPAQFKFNSEACITAWKEAGNRVQWRSPRRAA
jgi:hypothetical protein